MRYLLLSGALGVLLSSGCGDACEELQLVCDSCNDPNHKASCERMVDSQEQDACQQNIDNFNNICN